MPDPNWPVLERDVVVARPIGQFKNGPVEGRLDDAVIAQLVKNFPRTTKVPVYLWTHVDDLDEMPPDGWATALSVNDSGALVARIAFHGPAVDTVSRHQVRSASIAWAPNAKDYQGKPIGALLQHISITNNPFIKDLPSIAARESGDVAVVCMTHFALTEQEAGMSEPSKDEKDRIDPTQDEPTVAALKEKTDEIVALKAKLLTAEETISELKDKIDASPVDTEKEEQAVRLKQAEFKLDALEIRELVAKGLHTGTLKPSWCSGYADGGYNGTMTWFRASKFQGDKNLLQWAVKNNPVLYKVGQQFKSGNPVDNGEITLTQEDRDLIRKLGITPEQIQAGHKAGDSSEFKTLTAKEA